MKHIANVLLLLLLPVFFFSCKKDDGDDSPNAVFLLEKESYQALELAAIKLEGIELYDSIYDGTLNGSVAFKLIHTDSFLVFMVPQNLSIGPQDISVEINGKKFTETFQLTASAAIAQPDALVADIAASIDSVRSALQQNLASLPASVQADVSSNLQLIETWQTDWLQQYQALSADERMNAALFLQANANSIHEINAAINELNLNIMELRTSGIEDYEFKVQISLSNMVAANINLKREVAKFLLTTAAGGLFGPIGAAVGAGIGLGNLYLAVTKVMAANQAVLDKSIQPSMFYDVSGKNSLEFMNGQYKELEVTNTYRTVYAADAGNTTPMITDLSTALAFYRACIQKVRLVLPQWLGGGPNQLEDITNYNISNRVVHSKYLSIEDISSNDITATIDKTDGFFKVRFNTTATTDQWFSFTVYYNSPYTGLLTTTVSAQLKSSTISVADVKVVNNTVFPGETGENVHSTTIPLRLVYLGAAPTQIAIITDPLGVPATGDWKNITTTSDSIVNYTYNAQYNTMQNPGEWNLQIYLRNNDGESDVYTKQVLYTTVLPYTPVPETVPNSNTNGTVLSGSSQLVGNVKFRTHLYYHPTEGGVVCGMGNAISELKISDENTFDLDNITNAGYRGFNYYDGNGQLVTQLIIAPFSFYSRGCGNPNEPSPYSVIRYVEVVYN